MRTNIQIKFILLIACCTILSCKTNQKKTSLTKGNLSELQSALKRGGALKLKGKKYNLRGKKLEVNAILVLQNGAMITNGTLVGNKGKIDCPDRQCFDNVVIKGTWKNNSGKMKWFSDGKNAKKNFMALANLITMGAQVEVDKMYPLAAHVGKSFDITKDIRIKGEDPEKCGFILETKQNLGNAYFRTAKGNNIDFQNISITTSDFRKGRLPIGNDYVFASCSYSSLYPQAKPDMSHFKLENCWLSGAVNFNYNATSKNTNKKQFSQLGIDEVRISNCKVNGAVTTLQLSNVPYRKAIIENNTIEDIYGPVFFFPIGGIDKSIAEKLRNDWRPLMIVKNNNVKNKKAHAAIGKGYMSFLIAKGKDFEVIDNTIENILCTSDGIETVPFYCSASNKLLVRGNKTLNIGSKGVSTGFGSNCLLKLKGTVRCEVINNEFRFNKKALVDLGLIASEKSSLDKIRPSAFRFSIWGADLLNQPNQSGYYKFRNNTFSAAVISDYSFASRKNITLNNNNFTIEYLATSDPKKWGGNTQILDHTLFYLREPVSDATLIVEENKVEVKKINTTTFYFTRDINDNKNFKEVIYRNNIFTTNALVSFAYPRSEKLICENELKGKGSFTYNEPSTTKRNRSVKRMDVKQKINTYKAGSKAAYHLKNFGSAIISTSNNKDTIANLVQVNFNDLHFYDDKDKLPITLDISVDLTDKKRKKHHLDFALVVKSKTEFSFLEERRGKLISVNPYWIKGQRQFCYYIKSKQKNTSQVKLALVSQSRWKSQNKTGHIILTGLKDIKAFEIKTSIRNLDIPRGQKLDAFIRKKIEEK